jgi:predicted signal transduction protein with EAL and GGDEF domain
MELDDFATLRTTLGSAGLSELLDVVAERLAQLQGVACVRTGDAFIVVSKVPRSVFDASSLADRLMRTIARGVVVDAFAISLAASMGVVQSPSGISEAHVLLAEARVALEEAKQRGRGRIVVLSPEFHRRRTTGHPAFGMQFEPVVSLGDGSISTYEATARAGSFAGFDDADTSTLELLLDDLARTMTHWPVDVDASFKVSTWQLLDRRFPQRVVAVADRYSIERDRFVFEIDARDSLDQRSRVGRCLRRLGDDGWRIGIGGFGPGTSVLSALATLPVQFIKINEAIVEEADPRIREILSISAAARSFQVATIAAGIATLPELALALAHEYDFAQGPLFGDQRSGPPAPPG